MKKVYSIILLLCLILSNISIIFADELDPEPVVPDTSEKDKKQDKDIQDIDSKINEQQKEIDKLKNDVSNIKSLTSGYAGIMSNFDELSEKQLIYYYNHYSDSNFYFQYNHGLRYILPSDITNIVFENNRYRIYTNTVYHIDNIGNSFNFSPDYIDYFPDRISDGDIHYGYYKAIVNTMDNYNLIPYKLTLNDYSKTSINPSNSPYSSLIFYENQAITLTYDDSLHDFTGWYDINGNLLSNQLSYTFNINHDTTIYINYNIDPPVVDDSDYFIYLILIGTAILISNLTKGDFNI